jgi:hypothetical protein
MGGRIECRRDLLFPGAGCRIEARGTALHLPNFCMR